jgi:hypothetical protein
MDEEKIEIEDESGDHRYFTMIPNYVLNHSTATAQALYLQMKRLAGENGKTFAAQGYFMRKLGISQPTLRKEMKYLIEKGWIRYSGDVEVDTDGGKQKVKSYRIVDLWKKNVDYYEDKRGEKIDTPLHSRGERIVEQGVKARGERIVDKEEPVKKEPSFKKTSAIAVPINELLNLFEGVNPSFSELYKRKNQRDAAQWLLEKYGIEKMTGMLRALPEIVSRPYAPNITTPIQLKENLGKLLNFINQEKSKGSKNKVITI